MSLIVTGKTVFGPKQPNEWDADFLAFWDRTTGTPDSWKIALNNFVIGYKNIGAWNIDDALWLTCGHNSSDVLLNLKSESITLNLINSPTFTQKKGIKGNGISSYIDTTFNPSIHGVKYTINDASISWFVRSKPTTANAGIGGWNGSVITYMHRTPTTCNAAINSGYVSVNNAYTHEGLISISRNSASAIKIITNSESSVSSPSTAITPVSLCFLAFWNAASPAYFSDEEISFIRIGGAIDQSMHNDIENLVLQFSLEISSL